MKRITLGLLLLLVFLGGCAGERIAVVPPSAPPTVPAAPAPEPLSVPSSPVVSTPVPMGTTPPPTAAEPAAAIAVDTSDSISAKHLEKVTDRKTLLQVFREIGLPDDNLTPAKKEQIAVYRQPGKYRFYHFRDSRLIAWGEYPASAIERMKQQGLYPREVMRDFNRLP